MILNNVLFGEKRIIDEKLKNSQQPELVMPEGHSQKNRQVGGS